LNGKKRKKKKKEITFEISEGKKSKLVIDSSKDTKELSSIWWIFILSLL